MTEPFFLVLHIRDQFCSVAFPLIDGYYGKYLYTSVTSPEVISFRYRLTNEFLLFIFSIRFLFSFFYFTHLVPKRTR